MKAIAKKPEQRYASAGELARALRAAVPAALFPQPANFGSEEITESMTPITLTSNDTLLEVPAVPLHEAPTVQTPPLLPRTSTGERNIGSSSSPIKDRAGDKPGCRSMWLVLLGGILAVLLVVGGAVSYLHLVPGDHGASTTSTAKPTGNRPTIGIPTHELPAALIPVGTLLYGTNLPACDAKRSLWSKSLNANVICGATATQVKDTSRVYLAGTFLDSLPNGYGIPDDYVLQVQVSAGSGSHGGFGVFFRNQPGFIHQGAFSFLLYPHGRWEVGFYNDLTGRQTLLHRDQASVPLDGIITIDVVVHGSTFTFYLNGAYQGSATSLLYPSGTIGLAAHTGADVFFKNLAIYSLPGS